MRCELRPIDKWAETATLMVNDTLVDADVWAIKDKASGVVNIYLSFQTERQELLNFLSIYLYEDLIGDDAKYVIKDYDYLLGDIERDAQTNFAILDNFFSEPTGAIYQLDTLSINELKFTDTRWRTLKFNIDAHFKKKSDIDHTGTYVPGAREYKISNISEIRCPLRRQS